MYYQQINIAYKETIQHYTPNTYIIHQGLVLYMMLTNRLSHINNLNKPLFKSETSCVLRWLETSPPTEDINNFPT